MTMRFDIITLFPQAVSAYTDVSILRKAQEGKIIEVHLHQLRDYAVDKHKTVDDTPYGGGAGMLLKIEPLVNCLQAVLAQGNISREKTRVIATSAKGSLLNQDTLSSLKNEYERIILICGRYEGMDERFIVNYCDEEISVGKYVLTGGELPALIVLDGVTRLIPGALGNEESALLESFSSGGGKEHPQYTKPAEFKGLTVPDVLLSGNHKEIKEWRKVQSKE